MNALLLVITTPSRLRTVEQTAARAKTLRSRREGFTLPELLVALVLFAVVGGTAVQVLRTQSRFVRGAGEVAEMRSQLRQAAHVLPAELRVLAPDAGDVHEWSATAVAFRSVFGASVVCRVASDSVLILPPLSSDARALTSWLASPEPGDSLLVHDEGDLGAGDDVWRAFEIASVTSAGASEQCDASTSFASGSGEPGGSLRVRVAGRLAPTIGTGAPLRFYHRARYALYRSSDSRWYLGASDCNGSRVPPCSTIQPVSGPYQVREGSRVEEGLHLAYEDRSGRELVPGVDDARDIAAVRLLVRSETGHAWWPSRSARRFRDSLALTIAVRNARPRPSPAAP